MAQMFTISNTVLPTYNSLKEQRLFLKTYDSAMTLWPISYSEHWIKGKFGTTHITECGNPSGEPLLLLHWFCNNSTEWYKFVGMESIHGNYRVLAVDVMGDMGKSIPISAPKSDVENAQWLSEVLDSLHVESAHIIGHSYGGFLAFNFSLQQPGRVKKLVCLAPVMTFKMVRFRFFVSVIKTMLFPTRRKTEQFLKYWAAKGDMGAPVFTDMLFFVFKFGKIKTNMWPRVHSKNELRHLKVPVLLLIGDKEKIYKPTEAIKCAQKYAPGLKGQIIPQCGHAIPTDQPEILAEKVDSFFRE
jgi:pimeloyl-ACP methyl ester carboxylesterase